MTHSMFQLGSPVDQTLAAARARFAPRRILLAGVGAIGSHFSMLAAPLIQGVDDGELILVDPDLVAPHNCVNQAYRPTDCGRPKVEALAERLRETWPLLRVRTHLAALEQVPWGVFADSDILCGGLHSLQGRQSLGERAYRHGKWFIDGGVAERFIGRISIYQPALGEAQVPCVECAWGPGVYRHLSLEQPCGTAALPQVAPTAASSALGGVVAGMMVSACEALMGGHTFTTSFQTQFDLRHHRFSTARLTRATHCRFDHRRVGHELVLSAAWLQATLGDVLEAAASMSATQLAWRAGACSLPGLRSARIVQLEQLQPHARCTLREAGFDPRDWLLLYRGSLPAVWLRWDADVTRC